MCVRAREMGDDAEMAKPPQYCSTDRIGCKVVAGDKTTIRGHQAGMDSISTHTATCKQPCCHGPSPFSLSQQSNRWRLLIQASAVQRKSQRTAQRPLRLFCTPTRSTQLMKDLTVVVYFCLASVISLLEPRDEMPLSAESRLLFASSVVVKSSAAVLNWSTQGSLQQAEVRHGSREEAYRHWLLQLRVSACRLCGLSAAVSASLAKLGASSLLVTAVRASRVEAQAGRT